MDAANFDRWTRLLAASSRRSVLRGTAGAALAAALGGRLAPEAAARTCSLRGEECTTRACCTLGSPDLLHLVCRRGTCKCRKGYGDCDRDGTCETNLLTDDDNCGRCRVDCPSREACLHGTCSCSHGFGNCPAGCTTCAARKEGGAPACIGGISSQACATDAECSPRTVCLANGRCSRECGSA